MRSNLPTFLSVYGSWGAPLTQIFYYREYPNPNQSGSPGTLPNLTGATFTASLLDMFDASVSAVPNLATYLTGATGGAVTMSIPQAIVEAIDPATYRYSINMAYGSVPLSPVWKGPLLISGQAEQIVIALPGDSNNCSDNPGVGLQISQATVANGTVPIVTYVAGAFYLNEMRLVSTVSGTVTVTINHNGVAVPGWTSISVTSTPQTVAPTDQILVVVGDSLSITYSANSAALGFATTLTGELYGC